MNIQTLCKQSGSYCCLFFSYLYIAKIDFFKALSSVNDFIDLKIIDTDFTVLNADKLLSYFGADRFTVEKSTTPPADKSMLYVARYEFNGNSHFVVCRDGKVIFNSLDKSVCVEKGTAKDFRIVNIKK